MNYGIAENEIVDRLNSYISLESKEAFYEAVLMPETEAQFAEFYRSFNKARAAVQYMDSNYDQNASAGIVTQEETVRFRLTIESKKLRGEGGIYNFVELIKLALLGYRLSNTDRLTISKYGLLEFEQGAWQPYIEFECRAMNVQLQDDNTEEAFGGALSGILF